MPYSIRHFERLLGVSEPKSKYRDNDTPHTACGAPVSSPKDVSRCVGFVRVQNGLQMARLEWRPEQMRTLGKLSNREA